MYVLQSWQESIFFLKPENLKLLLFVTIRTIKRSYTLFIPLFFMCILFDSDLWQILFSIQFSFLGIIQNILLFNFLFLFVLGVRPSVKCKTSKYVFDYRWHIVLCFIISLVFVLLFGSFFISTNLVALLFPIGVLWSFFWFDVRFGLYTFLLSLVRAIKMFIYNLPFFLIVLIIPFFLFSLMKMLVSGTFIVYIEIFFSIFYICLFANFYIKRLHDQFKLYFTV